MAGSERPYSRLFVAVPAPEEVMELMHQLMLQNPPHPSLKWMRPFNLHLTVYFIGNVWLEERQEITRLLRVIALEQAAFSLYPEGLCLRPEVKPRMIWVRYAQSPHFTALNKILHSSLSGLVDHPSDLYENPVPHITLARFKGFDGWQEFNLQFTTPLREIRISKLQVWESVKKEVQTDYVHWDEEFHLHNI